MLKVLKHWCLSMDVLLSAAPCLFPAAAQMSSSVFPTRSDSVLKSHQLELRTAAGLCFGCFFVCSGFELGGRRTP